MKHLYTFFFLLTFKVFLCSNILAQDVGVVAISPPIDVCNNSSAQNVTITIQNHDGVAITNVTFTLTFSFDGGPVVSETANLSIGVSGVTSYTFTAKTPFVTSGLHTIDACARTPLDLDATNNCYSSTNGGNPLTFNNYEETIGGNVTSSTTVCSGSNSGTLTLAGYTGTIQRWESSTDGGGSWSPIANITDTLSYTNLTTSTIFRTIIKSGICPSQPSSGATIAVSPNTVGGTTFGSATVCSGSNSGVVNLGGNTGNVLNWEYSTDGGSNWTSLFNTSTTQTYLNLTTTTYYRALVQSGVCAAVNSTPAIITVDPVSVGGTISSGAVVCSGSNGATLILTGYTGNVQYWESSTDGGISWTPIANTTNTLTYSNITTNTIYRAIVKSGVCTAVTSGTATITVTPPTVGGAVESNQTVCSGANSGNLFLNGHSGNILNWEYSTDGGTNWTTITNTSTSHSYLDLTTTTMYRAAVKSGVCPVLYSSAATITVNPATVGGTVSSNATVCSGSSGTLTLSGHTGLILYWEYSTDNGLSWTSIANTTTTQNYTSITTTTTYRAIVRSGVCNPAPSVTATITVSPTTAGGTVGPDAQSCYNSNIGNLTLSSNVGNVLNWEYSTDNGSTWTSIANTSNTQSYLNLTTTTKYRAVVQSGVCLVENSTEATISIDTTTVGGIVSPNNRVCYGSSNTDTLTLSGHTGNVLYWEYSIDKGLNWTPIANTTTRQTYTNLTTSTAYRAVIKNGVCNSIASSVATIEVDPATIAGSVGTSATVCSGSNSGSVTLTGNTGNVLNWEQSIDNGSTWMTLSNVTTSQNYFALTTSTKYRAMVQSGVCNTLTSTEVEITVEDETVAGTLDPISDIECGETNSGTLTLSGHVGNILRWEYSINSITWNNIANTASTHNYSNLNETTVYRAVVKNGVCNTKESSIATIKVDEPTVAGIVSESATVCSGFNSGTITLSGQTGNVLNWEYYNTTTGGWNPISNTSTALSYLNLTDTTSYRAVVQNGVCPSSVSTEVTINAAPATIPGNINFSTTVCSNINSGTLILNGYAGNILHWEYSSDGGANWINIPNTTDTLSYLNITKTTHYRAQVSSCATVYSSVATITVDTQPVSDFIAPVIIVGKPIKFSNTSSTAGGYIAQYLWDFGDGNTSNIIEPTHTYESTGTYTISLKVISNNGCSDSNAVSVVARENDVDFMISNMITLNDNGENDTWYVQGIENFPGSEVVIFNRNGKEVFQASPYLNNWNATYQNDKLPDGTYYYILKLNDSENRVFKGFITVLR